MITAEANGFACLAQFHAMQHHTVEFDRTPCAAIGRKFRVVKRYAVVGVFRYAAVDRLGLFEISCRVADTTATAKAIVTRATAAAVGLIVGGLSTSKPVCQRRGEMNYREVLIEW